MMGAFCPYQRYPFTGRGVMAKGFQTTILALALLIPALSGAQSYNNYYKPKSLIKRLSYENFRNIKMLQAAIYNYGSGESEVEELVDQYAEASALYFQNKITEAAEKFQENERNILKVAQKLAKIYRKDTDRIFTEAVKTNVRNTLKLRMRGHNESNQYADKYLSTAKYAFNKATDYYDRYINAKTANPRHLVTAIYYYRQAKENVFNMIRSSKYVFPKKGATEEMRKAKRKENQTIIDKELKQYKKDMDDNQNRRSEYAEKKN
jgi:hypothetical protein